MNEFIPGGFSNYGELITTSSPYKVKERKDLFELLPNNLNIKSILELGCADGNNLIFFKNKFSLNKNDIVGVDNCKTNLIGDNNEFKFIHQNAERFLDKTKDSYDLVLFSDVLEHIYNPWMTLDKTKKIFNKDGLALISVPNFQNINYILSIFNGDFSYKETGLFDQTHIRFFSMRTILNYLKKLNFKIINTGWREDQSLKKIKNNVLKKLEETEFTYLEAGNLRIKIFKSNIQEYFSQQILICFSYE
jgi:2-polyprenyl-3-methyl-5-hydroxy-6-metoxy-1,4-benzoquinol methylase